MKTYYVYILLCADKSYYTGITNDINRRMHEHLSAIDLNCYTYSRRPLTLAFSERFNDVRQAISFEKQIKGWSRKKKEALINGDIESLRLHAVCKNETSHLNKDNN